jgi:hypothetical protein
MTGTELRAFRKRLGVCFAALALMCSLPFLAPWGKYAENDTLYFYRWNNGFTIRVLHCGVMIHWEDGLRVHPLDPLCYFHD